MKVQLANVWSEDKRYRPGGWFASPKMDGVRAFYDAAAGMLFSRTGKPIAGFEHIAEELRAVCEAYSEGRSEGLLKHKFFRESDFTVTGFFEGKGKHAGRLGGLVCEGEVDGKTVRFEVGTGFDDETREAFWESRSSLVGRVVEVKYQETTEGSLRFPVFVKLK